MRLRLRTRDQSGRQELPGQLYIGFVDSLLVEARSLFFACTASVTAALVSAIASSSVSLWACAGLMLLLSFIRMHFQMVHAKNRRKYPPAKPGALELGPLKGADSPTVADVPRMHTPIGHLIMIMLWGSLHRQSRTGPNAEHGRASKDRFSS